jgi:uncharacterized surface protein with fasciclin (FAS1) repeats
MPQSLAADDFSPSVLQRTIRGQAGVQQFFQDSGRAFCLYVVLGSFANRRKVVAAVNGVLASLQIDAAPAAPHAVLDIVDGQGDLTTLASLLQSGAARDLLAGSGPFTVFAPDDDAFATIDLAALRNDADLLARTIEHHVLAQLVSVEALAGMEAVEPLEGDKLPIQVTADGRVSVAGAPVVRPDLDATNGVVHVITGVLELPR